MLCDTRIIRIFECRTAFLSRVQEIELNERTCGQGFQITGKTKIMMILTPLLHPNIEKFHLNLHVTH